MKLSGLASSILHAGRRFRRSDRAAEVPAHLRRRGAGDTTRNRLVIAMGAFVLVYGAIAGRLVMLGFQEPADPVALGSAQSAIAAARPDILDRNGEILATDIKTASLYAEPRRIVDADEATEMLATVFPDLGTDAVRRKLASDAGFVWLKREISPREQERVHKLGIPGIGFLSESRRFYPSGRSVGFVVGHVNVDNQGIAGIEKYIDDQWLADLHKLGFAMTPNLEPIRLSIDLRVQHVMHDELSAAMERYTAKAAAGVVLDVRSGEVIAMTSLPDYDPNNPVEALDPNRMNRASSAVYEMGSTFKLFATAMALDSGKVTMHDSFDASAPLRIGGFTIRDFHGKHRVLSVPEIFIYSSNIGTGREALAVGSEGQQEFLRRLGLMDRVSTELPEVARPILPKRWSDLVTVTVSFGHGISVSEYHGKLAEARAQLQKVTTRDPHHPEAWLARPCSMRIEAQGRNWRQSTTDQLLSELQLPFRVLGVGQ